MNLIKLEEVLFVFDNWTLMLKSESCSELVPGKNVSLFNEAEKQLGEATLVKYLRSKNPDISAIEIKVNSDLDDLKQVRFVALI